MSNQNCRINNILGLSGGLLMDKVGRKGSMMGISVFFALSYLLLACAKNVWMLLIGRFLTGIASGMTTVNYLKIAIDSELTT